MKTRLMICLLASVVAVGCRKPDWLKSMTETGQPTSEAHAPSGRFALLSSGTEIIRMDTATGETWTRIDGEWKTVPDNLVIHGEVNKTTGKIDWNTKTPDGRDLQDLSQRELIRLLEATARKKPCPDSDPLGAAFSLLDEALAKEKRAGLKE